MRQCVDCGRALLNLAQRCPDCKLVHRKAYDREYNRLHGCERSAPDAPLPVVEQRFRTALARIRASGQFALTEDTIRAQSAAWRRHWPVGDDR